MNTTLYDEALKNVKGLTWLPWVGREFAEQQRRLLVVGESHYAQGNTEEEFKEDVRCQQHPDFTRNLVRETEIENLYPITLLQNFWKAFFSHTPTDSAHYNKVTFYNFIQRPMDYRAATKDAGKAVPVAKDFKNGWQVFPEVVRLLKPTDIIVLSLTAGKGFGNLKITPGVSDFKYEYASKIQEVSPLTGSFTMDGHPVQVTFIKHCSSYFSPAAWHEFLFNRHPAVMSQLSR